MTKSTILILVLVVLAAIAWITLAELPRGQEAAYLTGDFGYYLPAFRAFQKGRNPYDLAAQVSEALKLGQVPEEVKFLWTYHPWFFVVAAPVLYWHAALGLAIYTTLGLVCVLVALHVALSIFVNPPVPKIYSSLIALSFLPFLFALYFVQTGPFVAAAFFACFFLFERKKEWYVGPFTLIVSLKINTVYLILPVLLAVTIRERRYRWLISAIISHAVMILVAESWCPGLTRFWLDSASTAGENVANLLTPTVPKLVQTSLSDGQGIMPAWPLFTIPLTALSITAYWLWGQPTKGLLLRTTPYLLPLSLITTPYAWATDFVVLLLPYSLAWLQADRCSESKSLLLKMALVLPQVSCCLQVWAGYSLYFHMWWFPLLMLLAIALALRTPSTLVLRSLKTTDSRG